MKLSGIRFFSNLILFFVLTACSGPLENSDDITIIWREGKAVAISIPRQLLNQIPKDSIQHLLTVHLADSLSQPAILGEYEMDEEQVTFKPLFPFTRSLKYNVRFRKTLIGEIEIQGESTYPPELLAIYPSNDTLPLNVLKFYFHFSRPMREGQSLQHILLIKNGNDTVSVFLDLQPELWNHDRTMLTLWVDPGRIKRELQPNIKLGPPFDENSTYELVVKNSWQDAEGSYLAKNYLRKFVLSGRDSLSPDVQRWSIQTPASRTGEPVMIMFHEPLDFVLAKEGINVLDHAGDIVPGRAELLNEESVMKFFPYHPWAAGNYILQSEVRLEDLAGNNLSRLFDRDLTIQSGTPEQKIYNRKFIVR